MTQGRWLWPQCHSLQDPVRADARTRDPAPYPGAALRSPARSPCCGGSRRSPRSSGSRACRRSAAGPSGYRAPPPPGPCLRARERQGGEAARAQGCTHLPAPPSRQRGTCPTPPGPAPGLPPPGARSGHSLAVRNSQVPSQLASCADTKTTQWVFFSLHN